MLTMTSPSTIATTVVVMYKAIVRPPIEDSFERSFRSETPLIREAMINGIAISFRLLMKIVPNGLIQSTTNSLGPKPAAEFHAPGCRE